MPVALPVIDNKSKMEDQLDAQIVDFANHYLGGGVLSYGSTQEEILFLTHPQLMASMLVCEVMRDAEAVEIRGALKHSLYSGYTSTLKYEGSPSETVRNDFIAIDALHFVKDFKSSTHNQYPEAM